MLTAIPIYYIGLAVSMCVHILYLYRLTGQLSLIAYQ